MNLIDEVDYHCCIFCDKLFPSEYELLLHVSEMHQDIMDLNDKPKNRDEAITMEYIQSTFVDEENGIQCDEYFETVYNKSPAQRVIYTNIIIIVYRLFNIIYVSLLLLIL